MSKVPFAETSAWNGDHVREQARIAQAILGRRAARSRPAAVLSITDSASANAFTSRWMVDGIFRNDAPVE